MRLALNILRICFGLLFLASATLKMFPIEAFEVILIKQVGISWKWVAYASRFLIISEFLIGIAILVNVEVKKALIASLLMLTGFSVYLVLQMASGAEVDNCGCFGELIPMNTTQSLIKNILFFLVAIALLFSVKAKNTFWPKLSGFAISYGALIFVMLQTPFPSIETEEIGNNSIVPFQAIADEEALNLNDQHFFLIMFAECAHCEQLAATLSTMRLEDDLDRFHIYIYGHPTRVREFSEKTGIVNLNPKATKDRGVLAAIDGTFPTMVSVDSSLIKKMWVGASINTQLFNQNFD